ncbi:hypothetical protein C8Q73DRAFT_163578 [Cubamyces lactineus]|nr:hypothetical protein C8Q73DRAFT_163578 [Cubamyces lactineus]
MRRDVPPINTNMDGGAGSRQEQSSTTASSGLHPDAHIDLLLKSSQQTLWSLGETFRIVANQTLTLTTLSPALGAVKKIEALEVEVKSHGDGQKAYIEKAWNEVGQKVEERIEKMLRPRVSEMVEAAIEKVIGHRVQDALEKQIQKEQKETIEKYKARILEVKILLTNAEARRSNEQCRREFSAEPLRPLLRPPGASPPDTAAAPGNTREGKGAKASQKATTSDAGERSAAAGTPSPLFPRHVVQLSRMSARDARQLVLDYGLSVGDGKERLDDWEDLGEPDDKGAGTGKGSGNKQNGNAGGGSEKKGTKAKDAKDAQEKEEKAKREREEKLVAREQARREDLNAFMQFIGVSCFTASVSSWV